MGLLQIIIIIIISLLISVALQHTEPLMIGGRLIFFAYFLSLSLYANHALAQVTNITFSDRPTTCSPVTVSWKGGTPPFTVVFSTVDALRADGTIQGFPVQVSGTGNARRVVWTAAIQAGEVLVAIVRDGLERNFVSPKRVVQASNNVTCLSALVRGPFFSVSLSDATITKTNRHQRTPRPLPLFSHPCRPVQSGLQQILFPPRL